MAADESRGGNRKRRLSVREKDLGELYLLVQGSPFANSVLDAQASLAQDDLAMTLKLVESARDRYRQSNWRTLRQEIDLAEGQSKQDLLQAQVETETGPLQECVSGV